LTRLTASSGQSITFTYNAGGVISTATDSTGRVTTYTYDPTNRYLLSATDPTGRTTRYTYDTTGPAATRNALLSVQNPDGTTEHFTYDSQGRLASTYLDAGTQTVTYKYGPGPGDVAATDADNGTTLYAYDWAGLLAKATDALGNTVHFAYDSNDNLTQIIDAAGQVSLYSYDSRGNLVRTVQPNGSAVSYAYDGPYDRLTSFTDPNGNLTQYRYDNQGNQLAITYPNSAQEQFSYDPLGNLTQSVNGRGQATSYTYNSAGQLTREGFADGTHLTYAYDAHGQLTSAADGTGTTTFQYDPVTEDLLKVTYPNGRFLQFTYDGAGRRTRSVDQDGFTVNYVYAADNLAGLKDGSGNWIVQYTYDLAGRLTRKDLANGTYTTYGYDLAGHTLHLVNHAPTGSVNSRFDYTYDELGRCTAMTTLDGQWTYQYDPAGQLTDAVFSSTNPAVPGQDLQYVYDTAGNRVSTIINGVTTTYVTNDLNQYTQVGAASYAYDADGNLISVTGGGVTTRYSYDQLNRLIAVTSPADTSSYLYDPLGNLAAMTDNGQTTQYLVDPVGSGNVVGQYNGSGSLMAHDTYGLGLTSRVDSTGQATYYDFDAIGSTAGLSNPSGAYVNRYSYLPFGEFLSSRQAVANPFTFVGAFGVMREANGLDYMRARSYSSTLARFTSQDPVGLAGGNLDLYVYADNAPTMRIDPQGWWGEWDPFIGGLADLQRAKTDYFKPGQLEKVEAEQYVPASERFGYHAQQLAAEVITGEVVDKFFVAPAEVVSPIVGGLVKIAMGAGDVIDTLRAGFDILKPSAGQFIDDLRKGFDSLTAPIPDWLSHREDLKSILSRIVNAFDPNDIIGPAGFGPAGFLAPDQPFSYRIDFENEASATAPAQLVVVTDQLDANLDWGTFELTEVGFGDVHFDIPDQSQYFQTTLPLTQGDQTFDVEIEVGLNSQTGRLTAVFQSIDPDTNLPPDVLAGFLPPEDGTGRGQGYLSYLILPKAGLPTGTQIRNVAQVQFDLGQIITTDQVAPHDPSKGVDPKKQALNTIDAGPPTSGVSPLPAVSPTTFTVSWSGQDDPGGSGIAAFDVFVSDNGGSFTPLLTGTTDTSATFTGVNGHTYAFYSVATDNVGNVQPTPTTAQAATTVILAEPPVAHLSDPAAGSTAIDWKLDVRKFIDVTFTSPAGQGIDLNSVLDSEPEFTLSGAGAGSVVVNGSPASLGGNTFRYSFTGAFGNGPVNLDFIAGSFTDVKGVANQAGTESFNVLVQPSLWIDTPQPVREKNGASLVFTVRLTAPITQAVTVSYATANGTAIANKYYKSTKGTLTFGPGKPLVQTIKVPVLDDRKFGDNVSFGLNLSLKKGSIPIAQGSASGAILEGDPMPKLSIGDVKVRQGPSGTSKATFTVTLSGATTKATTVYYATADGTASVADHDYQAAAGMLSFSPGVKKKTITVLVNADPTYEPPETFQVRLSNPIGATLSRTAGTATITNSSPRQKAKNQNVVTLRRSQRVLPLTQRRTGGDLVDAAIQSLMEG